MAAAPNIMPPVDSTLGALLIGGLVRTLLWGTADVQTVLYFREQRQRSSWFTNASVATLWVTDTLHFIFVAETLYLFLVDNGLGDRQGIRTLPWPTMASMYIEQVAEMIVRLFFAWRIWILSGRHRALSFALGALIMFCLVTAWVVAGLDYQPRITWLMVTSFSVATGTDIIITGCLVAFLAKSKSRPTGFSNDIFRRTSTIVNSLIVYFINTGLLISLASAVCLAAGNIWKGNLLFLGIHFAICPLYTNSLLLSLIARPAVKAHPQDSSKTIPLTTLESLNSRRVTIGTTADTLRGGYGVGNFKDHQSSGDDESAWDARHAVEPKTATSITFAGV